MNDWFLKNYPKIIKITVWSFTCSLIIIAALNILIYKSFGIFINGLALIFLNLWIYFFLIFMSILKYKKKFWIYATASIFGLLTIIFAASVFF